MDKDELAGIVAMGDLARSVIAEQAVTIDQLHGYVGHEYSVSRPLYPLPRRRRGLRTCDMPPAAPYGQQSCRVFAYQIRETAGPSSI